MMTKDRSMRLGRQLLFSLALAACLGAVCDTISVPTSNGLSSDSGSPTPRPIGTPRPVNTPTPSPGTDDSETESNTCQSDSDCTEGVCDTSTGECVVDEADCSADSDCASGQECDTATGQCVESSTGCQYDRDCAAGEFCDSTTGECWPDIVSTCGAGAGPCNIDNSSPGCEIRECCEDICLLHPQCCLIQWDEECAALSFQITPCLAGN